MMIDDSNTRILLRVVLFTWSRRAVNHSRFSDLMMSIVQPCNFEMVLHTAESLLDLVDVLIMWLY